MPAEALLEARGLGKRYARGRWPARRTEHWALRGVSFELAAGQTLGVVGASGSGKSTLARLLTRAESPSEGCVRMEGTDLSSLAPSERRQMRARVQLIPQQPAASLNPRFTAEEVIAEPLEIAARQSRDAARKRVRELMELTGLPSTAAGRLALELSGGERQRLAIARALALNPKLLILDESLSGLDLSVQAQIVNLLLDLQRRACLAYVVISHDLSVVWNIADRLAVLDGGRLVESGDAALVLAHPQHARTRELVDAAAALAWGATA